MIKPAKEPQDLVVLANTERKDARDNAGIDKRVPVFVQYHYTNAAGIAAFGRSAASGTADSRRTVPGTHGRPRRLTRKALPGLLDSIRTGFRAGIFRSRIAFQPHGERGFGQAEIPYAIFRRPDSIERRRRTAYSLCGGVYLCTLSTAFSTFCAAHLFRFNFLCLAPVSRVFSPDAL